MRRSAADHASQAACSDVDLEGCGRERAGPLGKPARIPTVSRGGERKLHIADDLVSDPPTGNHFGGSSAHIGVPLRLRSVAPTDK
jgi:hypothetical protein